MMHKHEILTLLDDDHRHESVSSPSSSPPFDHSPPKPKSIPKSLSYSRLNAKALEFIPRSNSTSSLMLTSATSPRTSPGTTIAVSPTTPSASSSTQQTSFVIPQPPGPPTLIHVYTTTTAPAGATTVITHVPVQGAYHVPVQYNTQIIGGQQQEVVALTVVPQPVAPTASGAGDSNAAAAAASKTVLSEEVSQKILNQVEYYFSDINVATTDHLIRFMNKDPEGYVPISVVASFKKIKALISCNNQLANILRNSEKLVVSEDGKKIKRQHHLTKSDMEELQSRIIVAENLPEDHCHQSLLKIFSAVGSVKSIRTCQPQASNGGAPTTSRTAKSDGVFFSNKLHAFVEYETFELAEKAVVELNDENNWRNGLKVRLLLKPKAKPYQARAKKPGHENEPSSKDIDATTPEDSLHSDGSPELSGDEHGHESEQKKVCCRGRGKGRGRPHYQPTCNRGSIMGPPPSLHISAGNNEHHMIHKQSSVPRMPDGTRGFSMGRGKSIAIKLV